MKLGIRPVSYTHLERQIELIAVDAAGHYYTAYGRTGLLREMNYLESAPQRVSYVSNALTEDDSRMVFLKHSVNASDNAVIYLSKGTFTGGNNTDLNINLAHEKYGGSLTIVAVSYTHLVMTVLQMDL